MKFTVVAERSAGIVNRHGQQVNPFLIRDIFDPGLRQRTERRTWEHLDAKNESQIRRWFEAAVAENVKDLRGFVIVQIIEERA